MKKSGFALLGAANGAALLASIVDQPIEAAANNRVIEGRMSIPYGVWPITIVNEQGKPEKVLQRLNLQSATRLVSAFNSLRGRVSRFVSGSPIYIGHPDYLKAKDAKAWQQLGKCTGMEAANDALIITGEFNADGKALVAANSALAPSPHWGLKRTGEKQDGVEITEPAAFYSVGITPRPNIAGAAINEEPQVAGVVETPADEAQELAEEAMENQQLAIMAAEISSLEAVVNDLRVLLESTKTSAIDQAGQLTSLQALIAQKNQELGAASASMLDCQAQLSACQAALVACQAEAAGYDEAVNSLLDGAIKAGSIIAADRETWRAKVKKTPAAANELLAGRALKTTSVIPPGRAAAANEALGGVSAKVQFETAVRERMAKMREDWPTAWNATRVTHKEIFNLMPNGGKA